MRGLLTILSCTVFAAFAGPAAAQQAGTTDEGAATAGDTAQGQSGGDAASGESAESGQDAQSGGGGDSGSLLSMGEDRQGSTYTDQTFDDWEVRCARNQNGPDPCQLYQLIKDDQGNSVAEISVFKLPEGREAVAGATVVTPLETLLTERLAISVDGGQAKRYPFTWCSQVGCFARVGFTAADVSAFQQGAAANLTIVPVAAPDQKVDLAVSLSGFTDGYDTLSARQNSANAN